MVRYNGTPRGVLNCNEGGCIRCNSASETSDECVCLHAEENALLEAGRERVGDGAVLYCNTFVPAACPISPPTDLTGQMSVPEMYDQNYTDRGEGSGVQLELQNVRGDLSPVVAVSDRFQGRRICRFVPRSGGDTSETRNTCLTRPIYKEQCILAAVDSRLTSYGRMIVHLLIPT